MATADGAVSFPDVIAGEEREGEGNEERTVAKLEADLSGYSMAEVGVVTGAYLANGRLRRYSYAVRPTYGELQDTDVEPKQRLNGDPSLPRSGVSPELRQRMAEADAGEGVRVIIRMREELRTSLNVLQPAHLAGFGLTEGHAQRLREAKESAMALRAEEAARSQAPLLTWLEQERVVASGFWLINAVVASTSPELIERIAERPDVQSVEFDQKRTSTGATTWDGENLRLANGSNLQQYTNVGVNGGDTNPVSGLPLSIALLDHFFDDTNPVFRDWQNGPSRIRSRWTCSNNPCTSGLPFRGTNAPHGSWCASAAAADALQAQVPGTTAEQLDRTGAAKEAELLFITGGSAADTIRALQKAVSLHADIVSESFGGFDAVCDGFSAGWETAVHAAHEAGTLVVGSAGNIQSPPERSGFCQLTGASEAPSQFVVGALQDPGSGSYSTVNVEPTSSPGSIDAAGSILSGVDVVTPGIWQFAADPGSNFRSVGGTSLAAPQIAGASLLFKEWLIWQGWPSQAAVPGWLFANMLAMSDRANGSSSYRTTAFDAKWGGGRFHARYYAASDHPSGVMMWETAAYTLSNGQTVNHLVNGFGGEPAGIQRFKTYAVFFEADGADIADIDIRVRDNGCASGSTLLGSDSSRDVKSMVTLGSIVVGRNVCVQLYGFYVPPGETRTVVLVNYYSADTALR